MRWGHPSLAHAATFGWNLWTCSLCMCNLGHTDIITVQLLRISHKILLFYAFGYHRRPQTLAEICRNMGICCGFTAVAARGKYPGFVLSQLQKKEPGSFKNKQKLDMATYFVTKCLRLGLCVFMKKSHKTEMSLFWRKVLSHVKMTILV